MRKYFDMSFDVSILFCNNATYKTEYMGGVTS